ncbi:hypothetical protein B6N60_02205 [Richelia sinica FACHB-800]|uniref:Uncharacterized protein n=1 Tax=Richelia sinica FACHB-800 TaxID=1357546 RepID=A0A975T7J1_9NOST|nr:hypothetical protein [Richelia sinica]MBD2666167.1 hypothetical protein [Richelia sinica FACHB-800]QXE23515.1 hypothetical protein B6N60_02205 [Richelia sinica FACHB-800]
MSLKTVLALCGRSAVTFSSLSILVAVSSPLQVLSATTQLEDLQAQTIDLQQQENNFFPHQLGNKQDSNLLIAKKDKDDDDDDDDDKKRHHERHNYKKKKYRSVRHFRSKNWNTFLKCGRLVNSRQNALVIQMDVLDKPITRYANAVYTVYARRSNSWVQIYNTTGARLIEEQAGQFRLSPEIIDFNQLQLRGIDLSRAELRVVAQIRYDLSSQRDQRVEFENIFNYRDIAQFSSINEITNINYTSTRNNERDDDDEDDDDRRRHNNYQQNYSREQYRSFKYFRSQNWNTYLKSAKLVNSQRNAIVIQMDVLDKPVTRDANVVYSLYAKRNNSWAQLYSSTGSRIIEGQRGQFRLEPEIIDFNQLQIRGSELSRTELRVVAQIRYDLTSQPDQSVVFEHIFNYRDIAEFSSINQIKNISYTRTTTNVRNDDREHNHNRRDKKKKKHRSAKYFRTNNWSTYLKCGRLVNSRRNALVVQMDVLDKPVTRYANAVYTVYARRANSWVQIYNTTGSRLIEEQAGQFRLSPEIIDFNQLQIRGVDLSRSQLKVIAQIRYDLASQRDQRVVFENILDYRDITQVSSINEITNISYAGTSGNVHDYDNDDDDDDD